MELTKHVSLTLARHSIESNFVINVF